MVRWVASYPKSGNTWVRLFILAHIFGKRFDPNYRDSNHVNEQQPDLYREIANTGWLEPNQTLLLRGAVLVRLMLNSTSGSPFVKTHVANVQVDGTQLIPPTITDRAIYIIRDPRAVAVSCADHYGKTVDQVLDDMSNQRFATNRDGYEELPFFLSDWSTHVRSWAEQDHAYDTLVARYEDLFNPKSWQVLAEFIGLEPDQERTKLAFDLTQFERLQKHEQDHGSISVGSKQSRFFRSGRPDQWQEVLTAAQVDRIIQDHGKVMAKHGYLDAHENVTVQ